MNHEDEKFEFREITATWSGIKAKLKTFLLIAPVMLGTAAGFLFLMGRCGVEPPLNSTTSSQRNAVLLKMEQDRTMEAMRQAANTLPPSLPPQRTNHAQSGALEAMNERLRLLEHAREEIGATLPSIGYTSEEFPGLHKALLESRVRYANREDHWNWILKVLADSPKQQIPNEADPVEREVLAPLVRIRGHARALGFEPSAQAARNLIFAEAFSPEALDRDCQSAAKAASESLKAIRAALLGETTLQQALVQIDVADSIAAEQLRAEIEACLPSWVGRFRGTVRADDSDDHILRDDLWRLMSMPPQDAKPESRPPVPLLARCVESALKRQGHGWIYELRSDRPAKNPNIEPETINDHE